MQHVVHILMLKSNSIFGFGQKIDSFFLIESFKNCT